MLNDWRATYEIGLSSSFTVTGGEPFLMQDIFEVLEELRRTGFNTYILSNGTHISWELALRLAATGVKGVQISIEGPEAVHDSIRGAGSFSSSLKGIRNLLESGIELTLHTTLSGLNAHCFMDVIDFVSSIGAKRLGFSRLVPSGGCAAGVFGLTILPDSTITPCRRMPIPIGNVKKDSLTEIWASSATLRTLRDKSPCIRASAADAQSGLPAEDAGQLPLRTPGHMAKAVAWQKTHSVFCKLNTAKGL